MARLFVFARHAESAANAANVLSSDPSGSVTLTARGRLQARALGAQLANLHIDLAVGTRLLRTQQTIGIALNGREMPGLIEPGFDDELQVGDLEGAPIEAYRSWRDQHAASDRLPHGESVQDALRRYAGALRRLLATEEPVTLVVVHELALRYTTIAGATGSPPHPGTGLKNAVPYLFDGARRPERRGQPGRVDLVRLRPLKSHRGNADSGPRAWAGSWTGLPDNPSAASAVSAMTRDIGAASASEAREHASHYPPVVGLTKRPGDDTPAWPSSDRQFPARRSVPVKEGLSCGRRDVRYRGSRAAR